MVVTPALLAAAVDLVPPRRYKYHGEATMKGLHVLGEGEREKVEETEMDLTVMETAELGNWVP
jgi:hypothetical protein